jgi:RNA 3'-phosphate cyclase
MLEIDGAYGEGGGQLLRTAVALAALTGMAARISNIRAGRPKPGLAAQHLAAVRAVAELCQARVDGLALRARQIEFTPGRLRGGSFRFDIGTAGSMMLVLQALIPVAIAAGAACRVAITGGTDVRGAPPLDYVQHVLLPLLGRMGARADLEVRRRGYYPRGGGEIEISFSRAALRPQRWENPGRLRHVSGLAHVANLPSHIAERMRDAALLQLSLARVTATVDTAILGGEQALGSGGAVVIWAETADTVLGAGLVAERGVRAETLGSAAGRDLAGDLAAGVALDMHAADQILIYLALAGGESSFTARALTGHARTAMWLIEQFLPVRFETLEMDGKVLVRVASRQRGRSRPT